MLTLDLPFGHSCLPSCCQGIVLPFGENTTDDNTELDIPALLDRDIADVTWLLAISCVTAIERRYRWYRSACGVTLCSSPLFSCVLRSSSVMGLILHPHGLDIDD